MPFKSTDLTIRLLCLLRHLCYICMKSATLIKLNLNFTHYKVGAWAHNRGFGKYICSFSSTCNMSKDAWTPNQDAIH